MPVQSSLTRKGVGLKDKAMSDPAQTRGAASPAVKRVEPERRTSRFIFASPHSGRSYEAAFLSQSVLPLSLLRRSEDAYVDLLFEDAPRLGASLIAADFPRAFVDPNRHGWEFDPAMFEGALPAEAGPASSRAAAGLGVVPRLAADGRSIYAGRIAFAEALARIRRYYKPYHETLRREIEEVRALFGEAIVIDCHSMPSGSARGSDIVLGDRFGASCGPGLTAHAEAAFARLGFSVVRNRPYAGGYTTEHYGAPESGVHVLQIEINRQLYLDEARVARSRQWGFLRDRLWLWMQDIVGFQEIADEAAE